MPYNHKQGASIGIEHNCNDEEIYNFETMSILENDKAPFDFDPYSNLNMNAILKKWCYFLRMAIRWTA